MVFILILTLCQKCFTRLQDIHGEPCIYPSTWLPYRCRLPNFSGDSCTKISIAILRCSPICGAERLQSPWLPDLNGLQQLTDRKMPSDCWSIIVPPLTLWCQKGQRITERKSNTSFSRFLTIGDWNPGFFQLVILIQHIFVYIQLHTHTHTLTRENVWNLHMNGWLQLNLYYIYSVYTCIEF